MSPQDRRPKRHHRCAGERPRHRGGRGDPRLGAGHARRARGVLRWRAPSPPCGLARHRPARLETRSRPRAVVPGAGELHRRGHGRAPAAWQPRRDPRRARCAAHPPRHPARRAWRVRPARVRERQARSHRGRRSWPIWSMPRPRRNGVKRWRSRKARCGSSTKAGARSCSARRRWSRRGSISPTKATWRPTSRSRPAPSSIGLLYSIARHLADRRGERLRDGVPHRHRRTAQCRQVFSAECARQARRGDRVGGGGHHARCHRGASRPRRHPGDPRGYRGDTRGARQGRSRGD